MAQFPPERLILHDRKAQQMLFDLIAADCQFNFDFMLSRWFSSSETGLVEFLTWLDERGLEIRKKNNGNG